MVSGTLYYSPGSARSNWLPAYVEYLELDITSQNGKEMPNYKNLFPLGKVPAFKDSDGNTLTESIAIMRYFARISDNYKSLAGVGELEDANAIRWASFFNQDFRDNGIAPITKALPLGNDEIEKASQSLLNYLVYLDNHLAESKYFASKKNLTYVDIGVSVFFRIIFSKLPENIVSLKDYHNVYRWYTELLQHPVVTKTFK